MKKILITGAGRGLGLYLTKRYLEQGAMVFAGLRTVSPLITELKDEYGEKLIILEMDVANTDSVSKAAKEAKKYTDTINYIINNSAIHAKSSFEFLEETNLDECLEVYNVNSVGPLRVIKAFLPLIKDFDNSVIVNISSESGSISNAKRKKEFAYCMSKAALNMSSKLMQNYLFEKGIKVLAVHPGWIRTDMGGTNARFDPYEAAVNVVDLIEKSKDLQDPVFIDYNGNEIFW